jgi:pantoate--beta-alanine ligase
MEACRHACDITVACVCTARPFFMDDDSFREHRRQPDRDAFVLEDLGVNYLFEADATELFPQSDSCRVRLDLPALPHLQLDRSLETYYREAATLYLRLLHIVQPDVIYVGENDPILLHYLRRSLIDLSLATEIRTIATVREVDGLACAGRNQRLSPAGRPRAAILHQTLKDIGHALQAGAKHYDALEQTARVALRGGGFRHSSIRICDAVTLDAPGPHCTAFSIVGNTTLDGVRLQDHIAIER